MQKAATIVAAFNRNLKNNLFDTDRSYRLAFISGKDP